MITVLLIIVSLIIGYYMGQKNSSQNNTISFYAFVIENKEKMLHVKGIDENDINHRGEFVIAHQNIDEVYNPQGKKINLSNLQKDAEIRITYDGPVLESYPSQITHVIRIDILE